MSPNILKTATATAIAAALILSAAPTALRAQLPDPFSTAYVVGGHASYNQREGYRKFEGVREYQHVENTNPFLFGLEVGKRFSLGNPRLRVQAGVECAYGSVDDGHFEVGLTSGASVMATLSSVYTTGGVNAALHLLFPGDERTYFLSVGAIANTTYFNTALRTRFGGEPIKGLDTWSLAASPGASVGVGVEYAATSYRATSLCYNLRFMQSAHYTEGGALFPMGVDYREFFFAHTLQVQVLLPAGENQFRR